MSGTAEAVAVIRVAGGTHPGLQREVNEDRFHFDAARGIAMVIDGVGGQAAGGKAADTALTVLRAHLERDAGSLAARLREGIAAANNEIHRLAGRRPEWNGMACVLTVAVIRDGRAAIGHVGDTRLYKLRAGAIEKVTRDHSPVGEREDAHELSEQHAMQHPRRNEVYRDVGSELHDARDPDFIDIQEIVVERDAALLFCSDGLTDLVDSVSINAIVGRWAGRPQQVVNALIDAANAAGGKDNVTVVYVEGEQFADAVSGERSAAEITRRLRPIEKAPARARQLRFANLALIAIVILLVFLPSDIVSPPPSLPEGPTLAADQARIVVRPTESIAEAIDRAAAGTTIVVEPGEYRETLRLKSYVRVISRDPRSAVIRLPGTAFEGAAAVVARGITDAEFGGFRIIGDAATPLGTGVLAEDSDVSVTHVEIAGATKAAIDAGRGATVHVVAADVRDNPGAAVAVRSGASATVSHSIFTRNGTGGPAQKTILLEGDGDAQFTGNVFVGTNPGVFTGSSDARDAFARGNWFIEPRAATPTPRPAGRSRQR
jgi:serine/threonine protein phosphatase PrpC